MIRPMLIMLTLFFIVVGGIAYLKYSQVQGEIAKFKYFSLPPVAVTSVKAEDLIWQETIEIVGSFVPVRGVTVSAEVAGKIDKIAFESGSKVKEGDLLLHLDTSVEEAELNSAQSRQDLAKTKLDRARVLKSQNVATQEELDNAESELKQATADAGAIMATIVNRKTVRAPFTGELGIRQVQLGQYLSAGDPIVTLQALDPIYINFNLPQQKLSQITVGQSIHLTVDSFPGRTFEGLINAINPLVDSSTRNVQVQATVTNSSGELRPGMFSQVSVITGKETHNVTVPLTAINRAPYGNSVFIIEKMRKKIKNEKGEDVDGDEYLGVRQQFVKLGPTRGDQVTITEGLKAGEEVVTSGLFKLSPNAAVEVNNVVTPGNNPAPQPTDS